MHSPPLFPLTLALYAAACALYLAQIAAGPSSVERRGSSDGFFGAGAARVAYAARLLLGGAFISHAVDIAFLCLRGMHPLVNSSEALSFIGWLIVGAYLVATLHQSLPLVGALIVPVTLVLDVAARVGPASHETTEHASMLLATLHIGFAGAGIALFAVAAGDAAVFLYAERQLKRRRFPGGNVPSLEVLDRLNRVCIQLGFPFYTVAMVAGAVWLSRMPVSDGGAHRLLQPQYVLATLAWTLYAGLLLFRFLLGWRGRRAAIVTISGFAASLGVLAIYYLRGLFGLFGGTG